MDGCFKLNLTQIIMKNLMLPLIYFVLSLVLSLILISLAHKFLSALLRKKTGLEPTSMPFNILASGLLLSMSILMSEASQPMISVINFLSRSNDNTWFFTASYYILLFFILVIFFTWIIITGSVTFFSKMTGKIDEQNELKKGNNGIALLLAVLMLSATLFLKSPVVSLLQALIPMPPQVY